MASTRSQAVSASLLNKQLRKVGDTLPVSDKASLLNKQLRKAAGS